MSVGLAVLTSRSTQGRSWLYNPPSTPSPSTTTPTRLASFAPGILVLNKQIHDEALPFLYGSNIFAPEDTMGTEALILAVSYCSRRSIHTVMLI